MLAATSPAEVSLEWVYLPPMLVCITLGFFAAYALMRAIGASGLRQYFWNPDLTFVGFWVMLSSLIGLLFFPP